MERTQQSADAFISIAGNRYQARWAAAALMPHSELLGADFIVDLQYLSNSHRCSPSVFVYFEKLRNRHPIPSSRYGASGAFKRRTENQRSIQ
jgi:hypothetical protein